MRKLAMAVVFTASILFSGQAIAETLVLATGEWPPFIGENEPGKGLHAQIIEKVAKKMGYEVKIEFMTWKRAYELTKKGKYIGSFTWMDTPERRTEMFYPENELSLSKEVGFYKKSKFPDGLDIGSLEDIKKLGVKVTGVKSYWYEKAYSDLGIKAHMVADAETALKIVEKGRADLIVENVDVGQATIKALFGEGKLADFGMTAPVKTQKMYLLFSKNHPDGEKMMHKYDQAVTELKEAGEL